jgi:hypothetical protein
MTNTLVCLSKCVLIFALYGLFLLKWYCNVTGMLVNVSDQFVFPFTEKCDSLKTYSTLKYIRCVDYKGVIYTIDQNSPANPRPTPSSHTHAVSIAFDEKTSL